MTPAPPHVTAATVWQRPPHERQAGQINEPPANSPAAAPCHPDAQAPRPATASGCVLVIDNYDSFTYNLVQTIGEVRGDRGIVVHRNDAVTLDDIEAAAPSCMIISPGPGTPADGGISMAAVQRFAGRFPILGVCLGHQCIAAAFGARVGRADRLMHGKTSEITHDGRTLFAGVDDPFTAARYHSLSVDAATLPNELVPSAWTTDCRVLMAFRHRTLPLEAVQFHPESFLTPAGPQLLANFLKL